jgi:hypothetical protein
MRRRRFLAGVGASLAVTGCLSRGAGPGSDPTDTDPPESTDPDPTATPTGAPEATATPVGTPDQGEPPADGFAIGETTGDVNPHGLTLENESDDPRTVELTVSDADTEETLLDRSYSLEASENVSGELRGPAAYHVRVALPEEGTEHATTVEYFDTCNSYGTTVTIDADGSITSRTIRTLVACNPETHPPEGFAIGETTGNVNPHGLSVRNDAGVGLSVAVRIADADTEETLVDETYDLGSGETVEGELRGPAAYDVRVEVPETGTEHATTVEYFDACNDYGTIVTVAPDASLSSETFRTDVECGA